jgi:hypothetical protein
VRMSRLVILVFLINLPAIAQDAQRAQIDAARSDAIESLKRQVIGAHVTNDVTVEDLIEKVGGSAELDQTLAKAEELGGPRWLGDQAVQVRLSIDGSRVAKTLIDLAQSHRKESPVAPEVLKRQLKWWGDRIFSATGTSTGASDISRLRPPIADRAWWNVGDADRRRALMAARDHAVDHVLQSLSSIKLEGDATLAAAIESPAVAKSLRDWLSSQPVKEVVFNDDLTVRLALADPLTGVWPVLRSTLTAQHAASLPTTDAGWNRLRDQVSAALIPAVGTAAAQPAARVAVVPAVVLPAEPPQWSKELADAQATSPRDGSPLRTARRAEALAIEKLRDQINQLPLSPGLTVGAAAGKDPRIDQAIVHVISRIRPSQVDYGDKGAVTVRVTLRLSDLWAFMSGQE